MHLQKSSIFYKSHCIPTKTQYGLLYRHQLSLVSRHVLKQKLELAMIIFFYFYIINKLDHIINELNNNIVFFKFIFSHVVSEEEAPRRSSGRHIFIAPIYSGIVAKIPNRDGRRIEIRDWFFDCRGEISLFV